jgi:hypothetical protein
VCAETNAFTDRRCRTNGSIITHAPGYFGDSTLDGVEDQNNYLTALTLSWPSPSSHRGEITTPELTLTSWM